MLSNKSIQRISFFLALLAWLLLIAADLTGLFKAGRRSPTAIPQWLPQLLLSFFVLLQFIYFRSNIGKAESINFTDLLWRVFVTGLMATLGSLLLLGVENAIEGYRIGRSVLVHYLFYHINVALVLMFLTSTFVVWKRLILYQKTKSLLRFWKGFEYLLVGSLALWVFMPRVDSGFSIMMMLIFGSLAYGLVLSVNLKWVAYLNFRQKWKSILLILLVLLYLSYFTRIMLSATQEWNEILGGPKEGAWSFLNLSMNPVAVSLLGFTFIYALFSLLVILFNLPTSSVFEQKLEEVINFQRLSQAIQAGEKEEHVYNILLDSAISAVVADAAWLEINDQDGEGDLILQRSITDEELLRVKKSISKGIVQSVLERERSKSVTSHKLVATLKDPTFRSMSVYPLLVQNKQIGTLVLLKEVGDGFNREMVDIINTFVNQASVSIENFRLLSEALENERYKEELKIAQRVQQALLPKELTSNGCFTIHAFSQAADEVGGDYYDTFQLSEHRYAVIIGDVSGKGTSAAFNMSQMKGVFHSLVEVAQDPKDFLVNANAALGRCLEKTSFITISYFIIDTQSKTVQFARAGHCPTLYFDGSTGKAEFFQNKGLGLGILRNSNFEKHVHVNTIEYKPNDVMLLYTDGITEANNADGEEFGYDRLKDLLERHAEESPEKMQTSMIESVYQFSGKRFLNDDYSMVIVKFNPN
ncbi:MAG: GAF domain-containing SpoIIE family protein phosphatase [Bacteroidota bacterium]